MGIVYYKTHIYVVNGIDHFPRFLWKWENILLTGYLGNPLLWCGIICNFKWKTLVEKKKIFNWTTFRRNDCYNCWLHIFYTNKKLFVQYDEEQTRQLKIKTLYRVKFFQTTKWFKYNWTEEKRIVPGIL